MILISSGSYHDAAAGCEALSEKLWSPETAGASIQTSLDYLVYEGKATKDSQFWVAPSENATQVMSASGEQSSVHGNASLPALCTQTAPLASAAQTDNSSTWHISVRSNSDELVG